jgi:serine phosphatase RsbU (regulator of sigma subunit)
VPGGVVAQRVVGRGEPVVLPAPPGEDASFLDDPMIRKVLEDLEWTSGMAIPMVAGGRVIGMLAIGDDRPLRMGPDEVELALDLARRGASAYERARLLRASQERSESALRESQERLAAEHRLVALLQKSILPDALPRLPGVELAACYHPAESGVDVGGDWYDAFEVDDGGVVIMIGDVAGHGVEAATLMGRVRNAGRAFAVEDPDPASILTRLDHLLRVLDRHAMVTAIAAYLDPATRTLSWARAGHPPPLLCPPNGAGPSYLTNIGGTPLGTASRDYVRATETLSPDSLLVLFTDGLVERREVSIDEGLGWLASRVQRSRRGDLDALCQALIDERYRERPTEDDICVIALRVS